MGQITVKAAVDKAMKEAGKYLHDHLDKKRGPYNCGDEGDNLLVTDLAALNVAWMKQSFVHEFPNGTVVEYSPRKIAPSSGEAKFDLRFADGGSPAIFNYHVPFKANTAVDDARRAQSTKDKKMAKDFKAGQAAAKKAAQPAAPAPIPAAKLEQAKQLAHAEWEKIPGPRRANMNEKNYKTNWIKTWLKQNG